ncbi:hypothetical protein AKJ64_02400 [candidate division MSBL1 archaeon SCGC-AAA259E17]|uniref:Uncharacterized protein n=1 Tax=candidate division MSBL1 archaeon SCGC-AAA259E17 TaxID=1698263 RepID=A0A133UEX0_9EURY|nr:hypothetical protein AKJ64_02400 [candidate division MSBL1 archaeon SCGC-AAA259E17]
MLLSSFVRSFGYFITVPGDNLGSVCGFRHFSSIEVELFRVLGMKTENRPKVTRSDSQPDIPILFKSYGD